MARIEGRDGVGEGFRGDLNSLPNRMGIVW